MYTGREENKDMLERKGKMKEMHTQRIYTL